MPLTVGTDSYVTLEEAAAYMGRRLRSSWYGVPDEFRERALKHATLLLEGLPWAGSKADTAQLLAFPRDDGTVPQAIKDAQCELTVALLAYSPPVRHVLKGPATPEDGQPGEKVTLTPEDAQAAADQFRRVVGPDGRVLVLGGDMDYKPVGKAHEPPDLARCGATFHELPTMVQNLIGDYVALGARLSR
jgi:hypothetical protein